MAGGSFVAWCTKHFLPLVLISAISLGLSIPSTGSALSNVKIGGCKIVPTSAVCYIFTLQGVTLKTSDVTEALRAYTPMVYGLLSILLLTPLLGTSLLALGPSLEQQELNIGLILFCCVPTTVNSGVALTGVAGGNVALSLLLSVVANIVGIFTVPFALSKFLSGVSGDISVDPVPMLLKLVRNILIPLCAGRALRQISCIRTFVSDHKHGLSMSASAALALIPFMEISSSADSVKSLSLMTVATVVCLAIVVHSAFLALNFTVTSFLKIPLAMRKSVVIMASEKAITVAAAILSCMPDSIGVHGIIAIPVILGHFSQILIDASIVSIWAEVKSDDDSNWVTPYSGAKLGG